MMKTTLTYKSKDVSVAEVNERRCRFQISAGVSARVKVGAEGCSRRDGSRVAKSEVVEAQHQAFPGDTERLPNILKHRQHYSSLNILINLIRMINSLFIQSKYI